jgi:hypothetical protein
MAEEQRCPNCEEVKGRDEFHPSKWGRSGKRCKRCRRDEHIRRLYGIGMDEYEEMYEVQAGLCAICELPEKAKNPIGAIARLSIDHDHETGEVRGLLCRGCNHILGAIEKKPEGWLRAAEEYLNE